MKRITTRDVANEAKLSLATVDRVINRRAGVSPKAVAKIQTAIKKLGYVRDMNAVNLVKGRVYRIRFILPDSDNDFMDQLQNEIRALKPSEELNRTTVDIHCVAALDASALAAALDIISSVLTISLQDARQQAYSVVLSRHQTLLMMSPQSQPRSQKSPLWQDQ